MRTVYGYEDYELSYINGILFGTRSNNPYVSNLNSGNEWYSISDNAILRIPEQSSIWKKLNSYNTTQQEFKGSPEVQQHLYTPQDGETLYFDKCCTIPRIRCEQKWKRTIKLCNADVAVVPEFSRVDLVPGCAVYVLNARQEVYIMTSFEHVRFKPVVGETMYDLYMHNSQDINYKLLTAPENKLLWDRCKNATCIYYGNLYAFTPKQQWMINVLDGVYPRIVFENDLINSIQNEDEKLDWDTVKSIMDLLRSKDREAVHQGMRILANMDFAHYPSITKYILYKTENSWKYHKPFNSAVQFMLNSIDYSKYSDYNTFCNVTAEEFALIEGMLTEIIKSDLDSTIRTIKNKTNLVVNIDYSVKLALAPKTENRKEANSDSFNTNDNNI